MPEICCQGKKIKMLHHKRAENKNRQGYKKKPHALPQRVIATLPIDTRRLRRAYSCLSPREERHLSKKGGRRGLPVRARGPHGAAGAARAGV